MKSLKKILAILLSTLMILSALSACGEQPTVPESTEPATESQTESQTEPAPTETEAESHEAMRGDEFGNGAVGEHGAVSSFSELTSQIGLDILKKGGNAVDAAVATIFAVGAVEMHHSGIGGSGLMTIYLADENRYTTIEYLETIPTNTTKAQFEGDYERTGRNAGVPSQVAGLCMALEKYGTMSIKEVLEPVIKILTDGFVIDSVVAGAMNDGYPQFIKEGYEYELSLFTDDGIPYSTGDTFKNPDLAHTLQKIADEGRDGFYKGEIAEKLVAGLQSEGNAITLEDLANYEAVEREPVVTDYYGYQVVSVPNPTNGGTWLLESLNIMEAKDIKQYEVGSIEYIKLFNEAVRIAGTDAYTYSGDPAFYNLPTYEMVTQPFADLRAQLINMDTCITVIPKDTTLSSSEKVGANGGEHLGDTTHISVIDQWGNIVSSTNTVGIQWGCYYAVEGLGFVLNTHGSNVNFSDPTSTDYFAPGKRVHSSMAPTIVVKDGKPVMAVGSPGSLVIPPVIASVINNTLLYDMTIQEAINYPRYFCISRTSSKGFLTNITMESGRLKSSLVRQLELFGYTLIEGVNDYSSLEGGIAAIYIDPETGLIYGGGDPRRDYKALAY